MTYHTDNTDYHLLNLAIRHSAIVELTPYARNARTHSRKQVRQIADSIRAFGFINPVLIDGEQQIIAGHGRVEAAKLLGMDQVPTICLDHMTEAQRQAYIIADNRLAELAGWDKDILTIELQNLIAIESDLDFDLGVIGFETAEIDMLIQNNPGTPDPDDEIDESDTDETVVSAQGDLWRLGHHRLFCGDARDLSAFKTLMKNKRARLVFTDPPYNVPISGHVCGLGTVQHPEFAMASGEMTASEFTAFLTTVLGNLVRFSINGSLHYLCMDWRHMDALLTAGKAVYEELKNLCIWNKDNGGMGSLYRSKHELVFVFKRGQAPHLNNIELGRFGRYRTNVWDYPGVNSLHKGRRDELSMHPTVKPVALVADAILDTSRRGEFVLDAFGGAGTTILAAERTGRQARVMEIDPHYVDVSIRRWQKATGCEAVHAGNRLTFNQLENQRRNTQHG